MWLFTVTIQRRNGSYPFRSRSLPVLGEQSSCMFFFAEDVRRASSPAPAATVRRQLPNVLQQPQKSMPMHFIGSQRAR